MAPVRGLVLIAIAGIAQALDLQHGDLVFQSLPQSDLIDAIETATHSPLSHCGIAVVADGATSVIEAIGPVRTVAWETWRSQGREGRVLVARLADRSRIDAMIATARSYEGRPYDVHYDLDEAAIYCSELLYKAYRTAYGSELAAPVPLGELDWKPIEPVIRLIENGGLPLARRIVTPVSLVRTPLVTVVHSEFAGIAATGSSPPAPSPDLPPP